MTPRRRPRAAGRPDRPRHVMLRARRGRRPGRRARCTRPPRRCGPPCRSSGRAPGAAWSRRSSSCACPTRCSSTATARSTPTRRRAAGRHRHPERRLGAGVRDRAAGGDDQLQHRRRRARAPTSTRSPRPPGSCASARPDLVVDGPLQYDAAAIASVGRDEGARTARWPGRATVFVFPDLNTGNTTYKAVQRSADVDQHRPDAAGPRAAGQRPVRAARWSRTSSTRSPGPPSRPLQVRLVPAAGEGSAGQEAAREGR